MDTKASKAIKKIRYKYFNFFNKQINVFSFLYIKNFLKYLFFFFKNIKKKRLIFITDKKMHYKNNRIKFFNYYFDKTTFKNKFIIYTSFLKYNLKTLLKVPNTTFFFITKNKYYLKRLSNSSVCSKLIVLSDNNMSFSQFLFKAPTFYNFEFSIIFYFYFFKFFN